ncbi:MAG TPA: hypothetical protein VIQ05_23225 [Tardiphaga sp.]
MIESNKVYANGRTYEQHSAWLASLEGDEKLIVHVPIGHLFSLAVVAGLKWALITLKMSAEDRLRVLDGIETCVYGPVTHEALAAIEPADEGSREIMQEINKLPIAKRTNAFRDGDVFRLLSKLNPSLLVALRLCA